MLTVRVASEKYNSGALVAYALWEGGWLLHLRPCCNPCTILTPVDGLNQIHSTMCWERPNLETRTVYFLINENERKIDRKKEWMWVTSRCCQYFDYGVEWWMIAEWWIGKQLEGNGSGLIEVPSRNFLGGTEENYKILSHDSPCPGRDSNGALP
jgi:hypothetical protein